MNCLRSFWSFLIDCGVETRESPLEGLRLPRKEHRVPTFPGEQLRALQIAHEAGVRTWVSLEPVIDPEQALALIDYAAPYVGTWKVGRLNHLHLLEPDLRARVEHIDWQVFVDRLVPVLNGRPGIHYRIEDSLLPYWPAHVSTS